MMYDKSAISYDHRIHYPDSLSTFQGENQRITIAAENGCTLRIEILSPKIIRLRYAIKGKFRPDFSYAIDPDFQKQKVDYNVEDEIDYVSIHTPLLEIRVHKSNLRVDIYDAHGNLLCSDEKGFHWERNLIEGGASVKMSKTASSEEAFYGLGDKTTGQNLRGGRFENWGTDEFGYRQGSDPLYKNINLYYSFHQGKSYAIYFDNSHRTHWDLCHSEEEVLSFWAEGGEMDYYFLYGETLLETASTYTTLTGVPELPPIWSLGYQQCKWSYYPDTKVKEIAARLRAEKLPCDAIYLDIDYMDGFRCFTWDKERFPNPKGMIKELKGDGFKVVAIIDPGIKIDLDYSVFKEGLEKNYFCRRSDGSYMQGKVWPGECYFPDFTNPEVRDWWAGLFESLVGDIGLSGIWTDMNEPAIFDVPSKTFPLDVQHDNDGHPCSHREAHNVYGMQMARASAAGAKKYNEGRRPLVITRSGFAGMQRYTSTWTGDNLANWEHLYLAHIQTLRLSISGVSFCGSDVGGFIDQPSAELLVRWYQLAIFHPFFRSHSSGDHGDQEPWVFGEETTRIIRQALELRYRLLPYIYTCFYEHIRTGEPMLRPLIFNNCSEKPYLTNNNESGFLGDHMLYSPVLRQGVKEKTLFLPEGIWYDLDSGESHRGNKTITLATPLNKVPVFIREGAVIPFFPVMQHTGEKVVEEVTLKVHYGKGKTLSKFYHDEGDGYEYKSGRYRETEFVTEGSLSQFILGQCYSGDYVPSFQKYRIQIIGLSASELMIAIDGQRMEYYHRLEDNIIEITAHRDFTNIEINF